MPARPDVLMTMLEPTPAIGAWQAIGMRRKHPPRTAVAICLDGDARADAEGTVYYSYKKLQESRAQLIDRLRDAAVAVDRPIATPAEASDLLPLTNFGESGAQMK